MISPIKLEEQQIEKLLEMIKVVSLDSYKKIEYKNYAIYLTQGKEDIIIHWYELLINHLVPSIYMFGLEEFCLTIECHLEGNLKSHLVDIVYERFEQHIKNIIE